MFSSQSSLSSSDAMSGFDWLLDIPTDVDFVLGETTLSVGECTKLSIDSVVRLKQHAGSDIEIRVGGRQFGAGEIVIVDDNVSLKLASIAPPSQGEPL